ncbi:deoxynucleoside triphosphate triphosphohydrolase SAMHD1 isoform X2 [Bacillus rossius redtenbacheri]
MFKYLLENNPEVNKLFSEQEKTLINELIIGTGGSLNDEEKYLYEIISNEENGIDVDKWDYLLRDGMQLNLKITFDYRRLLQFCRILRVGGKNHVCFQRKTEIDVCNMFQMRALLHHLAYQHSVSKNIELMFVDALIAADNAGFTVNTKTKQYKLSEAHTSMEAFSHLTDHIFYDILYSPLEELSEAQKIIKRILTRDLYKLVGSRYQDVTSTKVNEIIKCLKDELDQKLATAVDNDEDRLKNFAIEIKKLDKGCKMFANPFANIFFFDKNTPDVAVSINPQNVPIFGCNEDYTLCRIEALVFCKTKIDDDDCSKLKLALNLD